MKTGIVFDIKEFAVFDGPGIRTTVFLKGCPLRCNWCHNPEGLAKQPQMLTGQNGHSRLCGEEWTAQALAARLYKNKPFFTGGGGITFSGGEPLMQCDFMCEVIDKLENIHTAFETSGFAPDDVFKRAVNAVDLVIMDLKCMDADKHKRFTKVDNTLILRHAKMLVDGQTPFIIRLPLIPGVNDDPENMRAAAALLTGAKALLCVEMLPYHQTAGAKYMLAGMHYEPNFDVHEAPKAFTTPFEQSGIPLKIL